MKDKNILSFLTSHIHIEMVKRDIKHFQLLCGPFKIHVDREEKQANMNQISHGMLSAFQNRPSFMIGCVLDMLYALYNISHMQHGILKVWANLMSPKIIKQAKNKHGTKQKNKKKSYNFF
jgi:hypothetical protein